MTEFVLSEPVDAHMTGKSRYYLRRTDQPGVVTSFTMLPEDADELRAQLVRGITDKAERIEHETRRPPYKGTRLASDPTADRGGTLL